MAQEIERKFLVCGDFKAFYYKKLTIKQGYLSSTPERTVRVRINEEKGFITVKGKANDSGTSRFEWEKEITVDDAEALFGLCEPGIIDKTRYLIKSEDHIFEVDEFYGVNLGLIIAEIELNNENENFIKPDWLGEEVTGDNRYYNSELVKNPFTKW